MPGRAVSRTRSVMAWAAGALYACTATACGPAPAGVSSSAPPTPGTAAAPPVTAAAPVSAAPTTTEYTPTGVSSVPADDEPGLVTIDEAARALPAIRVGPDVAHLEGFTQPSGVTITVDHDPATFTDSEASYCIALSSDRELTRVCPFAGVPLGVVPFVFTEPLSSTTSAYVVVSDATQVAFDAGACAWLDRFAVSQDGSALVVCELEPGRQQLGVFAQAESAASVKFVIPLPSGDS